MFENTKTLLHKQRTTHTQVPHANIIRLIDCHVLDGSLYIVMELARGGEVCECVLYDVWFVMRVQL